MASLLIVPMLSLLAAGLGWMWCRMAGWPVHASVMAAALGASVAAGLLALLPAVLTRRSDVAVVVQTGLVGTALHLLLTLVLAGLVWMAGWIDAPRAFLGWLLAFYWTTLAGVAWVAARWIRQASRRAATMTPNSDRF